MGAAIVFAGGEIPVIVLVAGVVLFVVGGLLVLAILFGPGPGPD